MLLRAISAASLADVEMAIQTLALAVHQELKGMQAADTVGSSEIGLRAQELSLCVLLLNFSP